MSDTAASVFLFAIIVGGVILHWLSHRWLTKEDEPTFHASVDGSPFGAALCGFEPEGGESVWVTQIKDDVNCHLCLEAMA